ncbi:hypothetical protein QBC40DRAFT_287330 [Triangularia verruculosa]|uniref:HD domain-containing protein n=1 Tax=Triangularia verruculosa TaxID=2587418 RepID=A0AAN7ASX8_9PEZI|nr:hypothetical protein QBC40DRAFT_287330 [Triangularia verruculosa]
MFVQLVNLGPMALLTLFLGLSTCHPLTWGSRYEPRELRTSHRYPTRELAGVTIIDTPLVRSAEAFALEHSSLTTYNHVMRSWLFGALMVKNNATLQRTIDLEIQAVSALLHDLGWDQTPSSPIISPDKRFEVDGAIAARAFLHSHPHGKKWNERRTQLVWDAIALHTERAFSYFKEPDVRLVSQGIGLDFETAEIAKASFGIPAAEYQAVVAEFPKEGFKQVVNETFVWLCGTKPSATYDTWMQPWGDRYVEGYNSSDNLRINIIDKNLP